MLSDAEITNRCDLSYPDGPLIAPFEPEQVRLDDHGVPVISYGLSSYGYDIRVGHRFRLFTNIHTAIVDPKNFNNAACMTMFVEKSILIPPNSFALAETIETFNIHRDLLTICLGKSTLARCGIIINVTPFEPEWRGVATIEISNMTPLPARIYAGEGIGQLVFLKADQVCRTSYADRGGKYQNQTGLTVPIV